MKTPSFSFNIAVRDLKEAVTELRKLAPRKSNLPILSCALVERLKGETRLTVSDLDARLTYIIPSDTPEPVSDLGRKLMQNRSAREDGAICVPLADLATAVKNADSTGDVAFTPKEISYTFAGNRAAIVGTEFWPAKEFPPGRTDFGEAWPLSNITRDAILTALPCVTNEEERYVLRGVHLEAENNIVVATDGRQALAIADVPLANGIGAMILPEKPLKVLSGKIAKLPWSIAVSKEKFDSKSLAESFVAFKIVASASLPNLGPYWTLESRTIEGNYPNWRQVVPEKDAQDAAIYRLNAFNQATISDLLKRLPKNPADQHDAITVAVGAGDKMRFSYGENSFDITLYHGPGNKPRKVCAKRDFWQRLIDLGCNEVRIKDEMGPVVGYRNGVSNLSYVFMPVRITAPTPVTAGAPPASPDPGK